MNDLTSSLLIRILIFKYMFKKKHKKYKLGIALSGGGARGFAHLGILKALREKGLEPDIISGVSAGAIAGAFIASGKSVEESFEIIKGYRFFDLATIRFPRTGLFSLDSIQSSITKEIPHKNLEDLPIPLIVAASNMLEGKIEYFNEGPLPKIIQASASIPVLFSPVNINGKLYADGGLLDNQPIKPLLNVCKKTILVDISPVRPIREMKNLAQVATRMFQLGINSKDESRELASLKIAPPELEKYEILDTKHAQEIYDIGYQFVSEMKMD